MPAGAPAGRALPVTLRRAGRRTLGLFLLIWGGGFAGVPLAILLTAPAGRRQPFLGLFLAVGALAFLFGLDRLAFAEEVEVGRERVRRRTRRLWGWSGMEEPVSRYRGVECRRSMVQSKNEPTQYRILLAHRDEEALDVELERRPDGGTLRTDTEAWAKLLGLGIVTRHADGTVTERPAGTLDEPVASLARAGKLRFERVSLPAPPGCGIEATREGSAAVLESRLGSPAASALGAVLLAAGAGLGAWWALSGKAPLGAAPAAVPAALGAVILLLGAGRQVLSISRERVSWEFRLLSATMARRELQAARVEEVEVRGMTLYIASDEGEINFLLPASRADREWARNFVLTILAG